MSTELEKCITILFRQKGKEILSEREFVYSVSMDLHWFSPKDAQRLLEIAKENKILTMSQGMLRPSFELTDDHLQIDYRPPKELLGQQTKKKSKDLFMSIVEQISTEAKLSRKEIVSRINRTQEQMDVDAEVAALVVARALGIDISERIQQVEQEILSR